MRFLLTFILATSLPIFSRSALEAQDQSALRYVVVFSDSDGLTHFRDDQMNWQQQRSSDGRNTVWVTPFIAGASVGFLRLPRGYDSDWHPAPSKRFVFVLGGTSVIEVGDGQKRTFTPGNVILMTDTTGRGHRTIVSGNEENLVAWAPVP